MEILKFTLGGKKRMFQKAGKECLRLFYLWNIHKIALLGLFGRYPWLWWLFSNQGFYEKRKKITRDYSELSGIL